MSSVQRETDDDKRIDLMVQTTWEAQCLQFSDLIFFLFLGKTQVTKLDFSSGWPEDSF